MVICIFGKMQKDIPNTVGCLGKKEIDRVFRGGQVAVHAVCNKALRIVYMGRCFPGIIGKLNFMARCTEMGGRRSYHRIIRHGEKRKADHNA